MSTRVLRTVGTDTTPQCFGLYQGSVINTNDPLLQGRVQLLVPQALGLANSNWAKTLGQTSLLAPVVVGQPVFVMFIGGDRNQPTYIPQSWVTSSAITLPGTLTVTGATTLNSTLAVTGTSTFTGMSTFNGGATITGGLTADIINAPLSKFKTANLGRSSTSLTNDSDLVNFPIAANAVYMVNGALMTSGGASSFAYSFTVPSGATGTYAANQYSASGNFQDFVSNSWTANNTSGNLVNNSAVVFHGLLNNTGNAAGTFNLQWGSGGGGTATLEADSFIKVERAQ